MGDDRDASEPNSFDDARGSAIECAACLKASVAKGFASWDRIQTGKEILLRIVAMLTKLLMRFDKPHRVHESAAGLAAPFEHEHDAAVATLWRALARDWSRRRPCEVGTSASTTTSTSTIDQGKQSYSRKILAGILVLVRSQPSIFGLGEPASQQRQLVKWLRRRGRGRARGRLVACWEV